MGIVSKKLRDSAKGQECTFETEWCNHDPKTVVLCHLPSEVKGIGNKSDDWHAAFGCSTCHAALDTHWLGKYEMYYCFRALQRTQRIWRDMGLITIAGDNEKKPSKKTLPPKPLYQPLAARMWKAGMGDGD